jgi:hypothetical protein
MSNSCPYCAQTDTRKDQFGYCKKHNCFEVSGTKAKYKELNKKLSDTFFLPTYVRNQFDGSHYNPREEKREQLLKQIVQLLGVAPIESLKLTGRMVIEL